MTTTAIRERPILFSTRKGAIALILQHAESKAPKCPKELLRAKKNV